MQKFRLIVDIASEKKTLLRAVKIAIIVGTILNLINQGDKLISLAFEHVHLPKMLLTYCVPFCVSMYTAVAMKLSFHIGDPSPCNVKLECKICHNESIGLKKGVIIPACPQCGMKTKWRLTSLATQG